MYFSAHILQLPCTNICKRAGEEGERRTRCSALHWLQPFVLFIRKKKKKRCSSEEGASVGREGGRQPGEAVSSAGLWALVSHTVHFPHLPGTHRGHSHTCARPGTRCQKGRTEPLRPGAGLAHAQINPQQKSQAQCQGFAAGSIFKSVTDSPMWRFNKCLNNSHEKGLASPISTFVIKGDLQKVIQAWNWPECYPHKILFVPHQKQDAVWVLLTKQYPGRQKTKKKKNKSDILIIYFTKLWHFES